MPSILAATRRLVPVIILMVPGAALISGCGSSSHSSPLPSVSSPGVDAIVGQKPLLRGLAATGASDGTSVTVALYRGTKASGTPMRLVTAARRDGVWAVRVALVPGSYAIRARQQRAHGLARGPVRTFTVSADPVVGAAGDIACDPASTSFHAGNGSRSGARCQARATSDLLLGADLAGVLAVGDLQYESAQAPAFALSFGPSWGRLGRLIHPALGNHEYVPPRPTVAYFDYFNGLRHPSGVAGPRPTGWYSFDLGNWHLIALNSNCSYIGGCGKDSPEVRWLEADLAAHPVRCTLAYWHHPRWSSGSHGDQGQMSRIWKTLVAAKADVVISGHDHDYERFAPQDGDGKRDDSAGIREFVVGTGGKNHDPFTRLPADANSEVRDSQAFGVLELALHQSSYDWRFVPVAGGSFSDSGSQSCH